MRIDPKTARVMAKNWRRGNAATRRVIERVITRADAWEMFTRNREGELIVRITAADRERSRNASVRFFHVRDWGCPA